MYELFILAFSFFICTWVMPSVIHIAKARQLHDEPEHPLKIHTKPIPRLGGVAIFLSFTLCLLLLSCNRAVLSLHYLLPACILLFVLGLKDDLSGAGLRTKLAVELLAALILTIPGDIRISNLHGFFHIYELPYSSSIMLSVLILIFIINAFNLIDGIDGLAAATGIVVHLMFTVLFIDRQQQELALVSLSMAGAVLGFLRFNLSPARIFMGDTGSLLIGMISAVMALKFIGTASLSNTGIFIIPPHLSVPFTLAMLILPIADTLRIFVIRLAQRRSPFAGDLNHIHHRMLQAGFSHLQTTLILVSLNLLIVLLTFILAKSVSPPNL